ncbi:MAG: hypothetical protein JO235_04215 [Chroococcidiopsidaceae cyanobacterium CP_BM_RX_35]|nr:hypothetical protein [Chroococcidiopsidaceae cyanobacterium CP_BM_RX_35]
MTFLLLPIQMRPSSSWDQNIPKVKGLSAWHAESNAKDFVNTASAAVPLSVYRELAVELQEKETILNSLNTQNQQLAAQNQQLRQEIAKAVQSVLHLSQFADAAKTVNPTNLAPQPIRPKAAPRPTNRRPHSPAATQKVAGTPLLVRKNSSATSEKLFTEQQARPYRRRPQSESKTEINGWWLMLTIVLIMLTAFSAGYLIVRPLVQRR